MTLKGAKHVTSLEIPAAAGSCGRGSPLQRQHPARLGCDLGCGFGLGT